jgi:pentatricopeptide repeat protein
MTDEINLIYSNYIEANHCLTSQTASILVKGFCRIKRVDKAIEFWKQLDKLNIDVDDTFYNNMLNGCAKN